jgi:MYXO-CTERM domain-containing protein
MEHPGNRAHVPFSRRASWPGPDKEASVNKAIRFVARPLVLAGAALLALSGLAQAAPSYFGVEIQDAIPTTYQAPSVAIETVSGDSHLPGYHLDTPFATGFLAGVSSTSASGSLSGSGWDMFGAQYGTAAASASGHAEIGQIGARESLSVSSTNTSPAAGSVFANHAEVGFRLYARDDLLLTSATLASGTIVDVQFTLTLNSQVTEQGDPSIGGGGVNAQLYFDAEGGPALGLAIFDGDAGAPALRTVTQTISLRVGSTYRLVQRLDVSGLGDAWYTGGSLVPTPANWSLDVVADHTSYAFADVLGDASLIAASGHDYASPVPLPHSAALGLAGLGLLAFVRRRHSARRDRQRMLTPLAG